MIFILGGVAVVGALSMAAVLFKKMFREARRVGPAPEYDASLHRSMRRKTQKDYRDHRRAERRSIAGKTLRRSRL